MKSSSLIHVGESPIKWQCLSSHLNLGWLWRFLNNRLWCQWHYGSFGHNHWKTAVFILVAWYPEAPCKKLNYPAGEIILIYCKATWREWPSWDQFSSHPHWGTRCVSEPRQTQQTSQDASGIVTLVDTTWCKIIVQMSLIWIDSHDLGFNKVVDILSYRAWG